MGKKHTKVNKAILVCGGYATRFLPISKAVPKEMLPIGNKPVIHYIVEELTEAGITDILILLGRRKESIPNYFDANFELGTVTGDKNLLTSASSANITFKRVPMPQGSADAILHAKSFVGDEPFIIAYGDDVFFEGNATSELTKDFAKHQKPVITTFKVLPRHTHSYGIVDAGYKGRAKGIVEKPQSNPPSLQAAVGRYLMTPEIFKHIENEFGNPEQICMTKQFNKLASAGDLRYVQTNARRFDTGNPRGLYLANKYYFEKG